MWFRQVWQKPRRRLNLRGTRPAVFSLLFSGGNGVGEYLLTGIAAWVHRWPPFAQRYCGSVGAYRNDVAGIPQNCCRAMPTQKMPENWATVLKLLSPELKLQP